MDSPRSESDYGDGAEYLKNKCYTDMGIKEIESLYLNSPTEYRAYHTMDEGDYRSTKYLLVFDGTLYWITIQDMHGSGMSVDVSVISWSENLRYYKCLY